MEGTQGCMIERLGCCFIDEIHQVTAELIDPDTSPPTPLQTPGGDLDLVRQDSARQCPFTATNGSI